MKQFLAKGAEFCGNSRSRILPSGATGLSAETGEARLLT
jgi:hypothetical protein